MIVSTGQSSTPQLGVIPFIGAALWGAGAIGTAVAGYFGYSEYKALQDYEAWKKTVPPPTTQASAPAAPQLKEHMTTRFDAWDQTAANRKNWADWVRKTREEMPDVDPDGPKKDNTLLYVAGGIGVVAALILVAK